MKIYLAGPMTGLPRFNFPAFDRAKVRLEALGHCVVSPADLDRMFGADLSGYDNGDPAEIDPPLELKELYLRDTGALLQCEAIALLPGWRGSVGSRMELFAALFLGLPVYDAVDMSSLDLAIDKWTGSF